jgi:hypothetical protein
MRQVNEPFYTHSPALFLENGFLMKNEELMEVQKQVFVSNESRARGVGGIRPLNHAPLVTEHTR